ncbi:MAG: hypothetical protein IPN69_24570 [Acidobacteria bacterium]|nr:hypothetical protein [Acidobacteriota bacterium]MBK8813885.1 hypothetical protein [Acidobacteriota bacterium]
MGRSILVVLFISIIIFGYSTAYSQCGSCIDDYLSVYDEFKGSKAVFVGSVAEIRKNEESKNTDATTNTDYYQFKVKLVVKTAWKTDLPEFVTILNIGSKNSDFKLGESYLVYAYVRHYDKENLRASIGCCSRTKLLSEAEEDLQEFKNKGEKPTNIIKPPPKDNDKASLKQRLSYRGIFWPFACASSKFENGWINA